MAHASHHHHHLTLNTDGRAHPVENALAVAVAALAAVAAICAFFPGMHVVGAWAGLLGVGLGIYGQYRSETTAERFVFVVGWGVAAVGLAMAMANGGIY